MTELIGEINRPVDCNLRFKTNASLGNSAMAPPARNVIQHIGMTLLKLVSGKSKRMTSVGFEPTPMKTTALTSRLRPLGHDVVVSSLIFKWFGWF
eukprot:scaffold43696_cov48-Attheya_sp.AAC.8